MNSSNKNSMNDSNSSATSSMNSSANSSMNSEEMSGGRRRTRRGRSRRGRKGTRRNQMGGQNNKLSMASQMGGKKMMYGGARRSVGSHAEVWHGTADHTSGGLKKSDLMKNKHGRIISKRKHALGKKALKNLVKAGFKAKKGTFKLFRK
jgi:hypothetical protein